VLCRSYDLKPYGELKDAHDRRLSVALNTPGNASFTMRMDAELSEYVWPVESGIIAYRIGSTGPQVIWSGYVNAIDENWENGTMQVSCVGWMNRLSKRLLHAKYQYTNLDAAQIMFQLFIAAGGAVYSAGTTSFVTADGATQHWPAGSSPNGPLNMELGGTRPNEGDGGATAYVNQLLNASYEKGQNVLQAIQDLGNIEDGRDFEIDPVTRRFWVYRKKRRILPGVVFGYNWGPSNLVQFGRQLDGSTLVNYHVTSGASGTTAQAVSDITSQQRFGTFEEEMNLSDVRDPNILATYSQAEIAVKKNPRQIFSATPYPWTEEGSSHEPFVDYRVGDQVALVARKLPRLDVNTQVRIFGIEVGITAEGNETLGALSLYPQ
jgi:hypothetical protein